MDFDKQENNSVLYSLINYCVLHKVIEPLVDDIYSYLTD